MTTDRSENSDVQNYVESPWVKSSEASNELKPWQNLMIAFSFGALLSFVGLSISMDMTHMALMNVSLLQWAGAIALPFLLGLLAVIFKEPFVNALNGLMQLLPY